MELSLGVWPQDKVCRMGGEVGNEVWEAFQMSQSLNWVSKEKISGQILWGWSLLGQIPWTPGLGLPPSSLRISFVGLWVTGKDILQTSFTVWVKGASQHVGASEDLLESCCHWVKSLGEIQASIFLGSSKIFVLGLNHSVFCPSRASWHIYRVFFDVLGIKEFSKGD